jgi:dTDP-4-amino-4,6-dideoxygalactose transaminase
MKVPYIDLGIQHIAIKDELLKEIEKVLISGQFILGPGVENFEKRFSLVSGARYNVGVNSGTDALILALKALGIDSDDEVITAPNSFLASASAIALRGAKPVFSDVADDFNLDPEKIEAAITSKTKAIIAVHLTGRPAPMNEINDIAGKHGLLVIEDAAQAVGAEYYNKKVGSLGHVGCFSLHPLKNLSAIGDGGVITTNDEALYKKFLVLRNHGLKNRDECVTWSMNSRLDAIQAAILNVKLNHLDEWTNRRRYFAELYRKNISDLVNVPIDKPYEKAVYHTFIIQTEFRDALKDYLQKKGIDTKIHYPIPIHLQEAAKSLHYKKGDFPVAEKKTSRILSLPVYPELTEDQVMHVIHSVQTFFKEKTFKN